MRYAAVISAPELAQEVGVSESTVTRAAQALGFAGYPALQTHLRARFFNNSGAVAERVEAGVAELGATPEAAAIRVMLEGADAVRATAEAADVSLEEANRNIIEGLGRKAGHSAGLEWDNRFASRCVLPPDI